MGLRALGITRNNKTSLKEAEPFGTKCVRANYTERSKEKRERERKKKQHIHVVLIKFASFLSLLSSPRLSVSTTACNRS